MKFIISISLFLLLSIQNSYATTVNMKTNLGSIIIELNAEKAPKTVANFLRYVNEGFYDGTIFHRVIDNFMIQGGGFKTNFKKKKKTHEPIRNEANNGLKNFRGTIAMARTSYPHSATAQFFINVNDNHFLNYKNSNMWEWGYAVFGKVIKGMDVVDKIKQVKTGNRGMYQDVPLQNVVIENITTM
jgi:peptidyl-prolyl cis-trans isomerase B (cyclophilin B)